MRYKVILTLTSLFFLVQACKKNEYVEPGPQLLFTVVKDNMVFVEDATITLYNTQDDWELQQNAVTSLQTDSTGQALFEDLNEQKYYFYVEKGILNNKADIGVTADSLKIGRRSELLVKIMECDL